MKKQQQDISLLVANEVSGPEVSEANGPKSREARVSITKLFRFEMAHALEGHKGLCKNLHGHSYEMWITLTGPVKDAPGESDHGMIMDFGDLKATVKQVILDVYDHAVVLSESAGFQSAIRELGFERTVLVPFQPTAENLVQHFAALLAPALPQGVELEGIRLWETSTAFAELRLGKGGVRLKA